MLEQDDGENWDQSTRGQRGVVTGRYPLNYQMGLGHGEIIDDEDGPPHIDALRQRALQALAAPGLVGVDGGRELGGAEGEPLATGGNPLSMADLVAAAATSHAFALRDPAGWDEGRIGNQKSFERRYGWFPETPPKRSSRRPTRTSAYRYGKVSRGHDTIVERFDGLKLDALIILGNDQDEEFTEQSIAPQLAIFTGKEFTTRTGVKFNGAAGAGLPPASKTVRRASTSPASRACRTASSRRTPWGRSSSASSPEANVPIVPIYIESFRLPCPSPARCYAFGQALAAAVKAWPGNQRIGVVASGGISHYPQSFPFQYAQGVPMAKHGNVDHEYDRKLFELMSEGRYDELTKLTNQDLLDHGDTELHSWITLLGMVGDHEGRSARLRALLPRDHGHGRRLLGPGAGVGQVSALSIPQPSRSEIS